MDCCNREWEINEGVEEATVERAGKRGGWGR